MSKTAYVYVLENIFHVMKTLEKYCIKTANKQAGRALFKNVLTGLNIA